MTNLLLLRRRNEELLRELNILQDLASQSQIPPELLPYQIRVTNGFQALHWFIEQNLKLLSLNTPQIYKDILSRTTQATQSLYLFSEQWIAPILRANSEDRLCLTTIQWLHRNHPKTSNFPAVFTSGNCAIRLSQGTTPMYYFPSLEQRTLLYQPLLFHEFGHFLYHCHKPEMDALVRELRHKVSTLLTPALQRNDRYHDHLKTQRQSIIDVWYFWAQELFCDAVGYTIGGPSYLEAFSNYLITRDPGGYFRQPKDLADSFHPVTWLRIHFLSRRAAESGQQKLAKRVETEWQSVAQLMAVEEDYFGYYDSCLDEVIRQMLNDMLVETSPRACTPDEALGIQWTPEEDTLIRLFNLSWRVQTRNPEHYFSWEQTQIRLLLDSACYK